MTHYYEIPLIPADHGGRCCHWTHVGGRSDHGDEYADRIDLIEAIIGASGLPLHHLASLGTADLEAAGIEDIRGNIADECGDVYAQVDSSEVRYLMIVEDDE